MVRPFQFYNGLPTEDAIEQSFPIDRLGLFVFHDNLSLTAEGDM